jgi:hypothetical protein
VRVRTLILLLLVVTISAGSAWAAPYAQGGNVYVYQFQETPPSWYVPAASHGTLYTYAYPSSPTVTVRRLTQLYSFATSNVWLTLANGQVFSGASYDDDNHEYRLTLTQSHSSAGTHTYTWSGNLFSFRASGSGTVSFYARIAASSACVYNVTLVLYRDGAQVGRLTHATTGCPSSLTAGWSQVSFSVSGPHTVSAYVFVRHYISNPTTQSLTVTVEVDRIAVSGAYIVNTADLSTTASPASAQQSGLQVRAVYTLTLPGDVDAAQVVSISPSPASHSASYSKPTLSITTLYNAQSQALTSSGLVSLPKPTGYTVLHYIARAPQGFLIVTNSSTAEYFDQAHAPGSARALQVALVQPSWKAVYTLAQRYALSVLNSSTAAVGSVPAIPAGKYLVIASKADPADKCYIKLNSTLLYSAALLNNTSLAPPQSGTTAVTFTVQDFGAGYQLLQVLDLQGNIVGSALIGMTGQAALNLTPYASYMITVCKQGVCKSVGLVTISSANIQLTVLPAIPTVNPPSWASASYDYSANALRVNVSCASPPCTVRVFKSVVWYNHWQMRMPVSLSQGWNLVFLRKSNSISASGMWAHINASSWSEIRFGDSSGLPEKFLSYSIIWSNTTHAQVLVYTPQAGTYYLYWQSQVQVPDLSAPHPFYACYGGVCGVRFNGINQYAQSWVVKNWLSTNQSSIMWQFYVFPNQTAYDIRINPADQRYTILQGSVASDGGHMVHHVPASASGHVAQVTLTGISGVFGFLIRARAAASASNILRVELYEDDTLVSSVTRSLSTTYTDIHLKPNILAKAGSVYTIRIYSAGGVDLYIQFVYVYFNLGSVGFQSSTSPFLLGLAWSGVYNYIIDASGVFRGVLSGLNRVGRLQTVTITVNNTLLATYYNSSLVRSTAYSYGISQVNTHFTIGGTFYHYFYGLTTRVLAYNRSLAASEVAAVNAGQVPSSGLLFYFVADPRYLYDRNWDGWVDWQDLSGNGNHVRLVNFHARGSFVNAPQRQPVNMLVLTQTCNAQLCSYTVNTEDPFFTVIVSDASGRQAQASTGLSAPIWQSPLGSVVNTLGRALNLDAFGVNVNDFVIVLIGLGVIYAAFTFLTWEYAVLFLGIWLSIGSLLLGGSGRLVPPGISLVFFGAVLSLLLRREREV